MSELENFLLEYRGYKIYKVFDLRSYKLFTDLKNEGTQITSSSMRIIKNRIDKDILKSKKSIQADKELEKTLGRLA